MESTLRAMAVVTADARLERVTVYARGARIRRVATISAPLPQRVRVSALPLAVIDDTVRVEIRGPAIATNVRTGVDVASAEAAAPEDSDEVRGAKRRNALARVQLERIEAAMARLGAQSVIAADPSDDPPAAWDAIVSARRALVATRTARELALASELAAARSELEDSERALAAALDRDRRAGSAKPAKQHEVRKYVEIDLEPAGAAAALTIHIEYLVAAARWAPSYVARLAGDQATIEIRAIVAQDTGEDWERVAIELSTAEPTRFAALPELAAQRIGRRQGEPARSGFRAPPVGAEALFADYDREVRPLRGAAPATKADSNLPAPATTTMLGGFDQPDMFGEERAAFNAPAYDTAGFEQEEWDEGSSAAKGAFTTPPMGVPMAATPAPMQQSITRGLGGGGAMRELAKNAADRPSPAKPAPPAAPVNLLDYGNLVMAPPSSPARGRLVPAPPHGGHDADAVVETGRARIVALPLPPGCAADWTHTYDYAFTADGVIDVRSDGAWHSIAVTARPASVKVRHVAVPREQADVFRVAAIANPFAGPLLPGPIDVYDRGRFLVTSSVEHAPPGAPVELGLGVDAAVKIARNTEFREEAAGMLRGVLLLHHAIAIDIDNVSGRPVEIEIRERIPVTRDGDDDVDVKLGRVEPAWQRWTPDARGPRARKLRGGYRWMLTIPAGEKRTLRAAYEVKISGKSELVGGNRRES